MYLQSLKLTNWRNFAKLSLKFTQITLLVGRNAQGKSNLLEAIYFLATTKSPRADRDSQLIKEGESFCQLSGEVKEKEEVTKLEIAMQLRPEKVESIEKRVKVNGIPRRVVDFLGHLVVVSFSPEDINLVSGSPNLRRNYLDLTLAQIDREYKKALNQYDTALTARNRLLKKVAEGLAQVFELQFWTEQMLKWGVVLSEKRRDCFKQLNQQANFANHSRRLGDFTFLYRESVLSEARISQYLPKEIAAGMSLIGPHRDDFIFELNGHNLAYFGSRGEQRTAVLKLKMAELGFIKNIQKSPPVLLLDDVFSELDEEHREYIVSTTLNQQTILSTVEVEEVPDQFLKSAQIVKVEDGTIVS